MEPSPIWNRRRAVDIFKSAGRGSPRAFFIPGKRDTQETGETTRAGGWGAVGAGGEITVSPGVARARVPRRKSARVPLAAARELFLGQVQRSIPKEE